MGIKKEFETMAVEDLANDFIGDVSGDSAVMWYGIYSLAMGWGIILWRILVESEAIQMTRINAYIPAGMTWLLWSLFPTDFTQMLHKDMVAYSVIATFFSYWEPIYSYDY